MSFGVRQIVFDGLDCWFLAQVVHVEWFRWGRPYLQNRRTRSLLSPTLERRPRLTQHHDSVIYPQGGWDGISLSSVFGDASLRPEEYRRKSHSRAGIRHVVPQPCTAPQTDNDKVFTPPCSSQSSSSLTPLRFALSLLRR